MKKKLNASYQFAVVVILIVLGAIVNVYLPWYVMGLVFAALGALLALPAGSGFRLGFVSGFLLWSLAAVLVNVQHPSSLPERMAKVLPLGGNVMALYAVTGLIGGIYGGIWLWSGARIRQKS
jgi:hypothetical protein